MEDNSVLMCPKCGEQLPNISKFCLFCGAEIAAAKRKKSASRRPCNSGTVRKLGGKRTKPYGAYLPRSMGQKFVGAFKTKAEAAEALTLAIVNRPSSDRADWTVEDFYNYFVNSSNYKKLSAGSKSTIQASWRFCEKIAKQKMRNVKTYEWQGCIDSAVAVGKSKSTCQKIRYLASVLCKEAMKDDVINKNYSTLLTVGGEEKRQKDIFTAEELRILKSHDSDFEAKFILTLIFTGMRISELLALKCEDVFDGYLVGGCKTAAGKNRVIPILPDIAGYIGYFKDSSENGWLLHKDGRKVRPEYARTQWFYAYLVKVGILTDAEIAVGGKPRLTPHCTRHTFASMAREAGIKEDILIRVIGHSDYDVTDSVYVSMSPDFIAAELSKMSTSL